MSRGRPPIEEPVRRTKYTQEFTDSEGNVSIWYYDFDKYTSGLYKVEVDEVEVEIKNEDLPLTQRRFLNPANGKMVGYGRAKQLKVI